MIMTQSNTGRQSEQRKRDKCKYVATILCRSKLKSGERARTGNSFVPTTIHLPLDNKHLLTIFFYDHLYHDF